MMEVSLFPRCCAVLCCGGDTRPGYSAASGSLSSCRGGLCLLALLTARGEVKIHLS
jgi:hypothetical protein